MEKQSDLAECTFTPEISPYVYIKTLYITDIMKRLEIMLEKNQCQFAHN